MEEQQKEVLLVIQGSDNLYDHYSNVAQNLGENNPSLSFNTSHYETPGDLIKSLMDGKYDDNTILISRSNKVFNLIANLNLEKYRHRPSGSIGFQSSLVSQREMDREVDDLESKINLLS